MTDKPLEIRICEHSFHYSLKNPKSSDVKLYLSQDYAPNLFDAGPSGKIGSGDHPPDIADLVVLSEHPRCETRLKALQLRADQHKQIIIAPVGFVDEKQVSAVYVIAPDQSPTLTEKISFDVEDEARHLAGKQRRGRILHLFETPIGRFSVLNCHDYTHTDLIDILLPLKLDFLIVITNNTAHRMFREYAISDTHHFFGFIILSNVASFGGSGVYGPIAKHGDGGVRLNTSGILFEASGPSCATALIPLPYKYLGRLREQYANAPDPVKVKFDKPELGEHEPTLPPESFTSHTPHYRKVFARDDAVQTVDLDAHGYRFFGNLNEVNVTIAQLFAPDMDAYITTSYRPSTAPDAGGKLRGMRFVSELRSNLREFGRRHEARNSHFLVLPEVFLPECLEEEVRHLVRMHNVIVLAGLEYEPQTDPQLIRSEYARGANRSRIYIPVKGAKNGVLECDYVKMTRSQYDARWVDANDEDHQFYMERGNRLLRFKSATGVNFGILICYDISHFEIINKINEADPVDVLIVLSHNPYADLYRNICLATCHRFYQYIVMCNVAEYGGSGVFGPVRTRGTRRTLGYLGQKTEAMIDVRLDIAGLRRARLKPDQELAPTKDKKKKQLFQRKPGRYQIRVARATKAPVEPDKPV